MPYTGSPISMDTIAAYDIKVSDYDVAADTVGATINAVTKSGTNEFHGSVYYVYKNASDLVGNRDGEDYDLYDTDKTMGVTFGGPIVKDKLFFFASYEEQEIPTSVALPSPMACPTALSRRRKSRTPWTSPQASGCSRATTVRPASTSRTSAPWSSWTGTSATTTAPA